MGKCGIIIKATRSAARAGSYETLCLSSCAPARSKGDQVLDELLSKVSDEDVELGMT